MASENSNQNNNSENMIGKFLDPKNDLAFKRIFGSEKNKDILIHFLNDLFANTTNPIEEVSFLKTSSDPAIASLRTSIVDVLCHDANGDYFIVEMQVDFEPGFEKRAQYYAAKTYAQQREKGIAYEDFKQVTFLAITGHTLFPDQKEYLSHHHVLNKDNYERMLKDFSFSFLELPKFKKKKDQLITMVEKWAYFFKNAPKTKEEDLKLIIGSDQIIGQAYEELNRYGWSPEELRTYQSIDMKKAAIDAGMKGSYEKGLQEGVEKGLQKGLQKGHEKGLQEGIEKGLQEGIEKGLQKGREKGLQEGEQKRNEEIAKTMNANGFDIQSIKEITGLNQKEIENVLYTYKKENVLDS
jgi:predicted transposase/invertase (TIGR01784 family)